VLLAGDSGTGKSTLIRAIAGLWPWGEGKIKVRKGAKLIFLPHRIAWAATHPEAADSRSAEEVAEAFRRVSST
jgi:putative ATP-binding cassette transporter